MKRAGIAMSRDAMLAKRDELTYLVATDTWRRRDGLGRSAKGGYARLDYYKVKQSSTQEWVRAEQTEWKPVYEAMAKENPGTAWSINSLALQGGSSLPYNAMTVNGFGDWEAVGKGGQTRTFWNEVHPNTDMTSALQKVNAMGELVRTDLVKFLEVYRKVEVSATR